VKNNYKTKIKKQKKNQTQTLFKDKTCAEGYLIHIRKQALSQAKASKDDIELQEATQDNELAAVLNPTSRKK
jgi:hypothetical protein